MLEDKLKHIQELTANLILEMSSKSLPKTFKHVPIVELFEEDLIYREMLSDDYVTDLSIQEGSYYISGSLVKDDDAFLSNLSVASYYLTEDVQILEVDAESAAYFVFSSLYFYAKKGSPIWVGSESPLCFPISETFNRFVSSPEEFQELLKGHIVRFLENPTQEASDCGFEEGDGDVELLTHLFRLRVKELYPKESDQSPKEATS